MFNAMRSASENSETEPLDGTTDTNGAGGLLTAAHETGRGSGVQSGAGGRVTAGGGVTEGADGDGLSSELLTSAVWCRTIATVAQVRPEFRQILETFASRGIPSLTRNRDHVVFLVRDRPCDAPFVQPLYTRTRFPIPPYPVVDADV